MALFAKQKPPEPSPVSSGSWRPFLKSVPLRNRAAEEEPSARDDVALEVVVPRKKSPYGPPMSWIVRPAKTRRLKLDSVGARIWRLCDGRSLEEVIDAFAEAEGLSFHESRVSVTNFLKLLVQRGAVAVAIPEATGDDHTA